MEKTRQVPREALRFHNPESTAIEFKRGDDGAARFRLHGYTGSVMDNGWFGKVVVDVQGVNLQKSKRGARFSILREHNPYRVLGAGVVSADENGIWVDGEFSMASRDGKEVAGLLADGVPLEASISIDNVKGEEVLAGESTEVNGKTVKGPVFVARRSRLREVSIVSLGADAGTSAIAAAGGPMEAIELLEHSPMAEEEKVAPAVEAEPEVEKEKEEEPAVDVEAEKATAREDGAKSERERFSALVSEFGLEFGVKAFQDGKSLDQARLDHYALLKEQVAELKAAKPAQEPKKDAEPVDKGADAEPVVSSFSQIWKKLQRERNEQGEKLSDYQAMKLAKKLNPSLDERS